MLSVAIYWLAIRLYSVAIHIAAFFNPKAKLFISGRKELLKKLRYDLTDERRPRVWMHCASLGEFEQGRPVLEKLRAQYSGHAIVLTFFSPSGYEVRKNYQGADYVFYLPIDSASNAQKFIDIVRPSVALFVKYDLWYFFIKKIVQKNIPLILVSAIFRKKQAFFKWYGGLHRNMLKAFTHLFVQDERSGQLLNTIGVSNVTVAGDTRFDRVVEAVESLKPKDEIVEFCKGYNIIVAGSTWTDDEVLLKASLEELPEDWKLILAPHEVTDTHISELEKRFGSDGVLLSEYGDQQSKRVLIVDNVGMLLSLYGLGKLTYVGGGFNKSGIHNLLEAAVYGKPVVHGPEYHKFREANELLERGASSIVKEPMQLMEQIRNWTNDPNTYDAACSAARSYVLNNTGATEKIVAYLSEKKLLSTS